MRLLNFMPMVWPWENLYFPWIISYMIFQSIIRIHFDWTHFVLSFVHICVPLLETQIEQLTKHFFSQILLSLCLKTKVETSYISLAGLLNSMIQVLVAFVLIFSCVNQVKWWEINMNCWIVFPIGMQNMFVTFITSTQQTVFVRDYGSTLTRFIYTRNIQRGKQN